MTASTLAPLFVPILAGLLAIAGAYWNATRLEKRKAELAFLNDQLGKLYGPLYALNKASQAAWSQFRGRYRPGRPFFRGGDTPSEADVLAWRQWMTCVFMPINERMVEAILGNIHLVEGNEVPVSFLEFIAHVEGYRVIRHRWELGDFTEHTSLINFPRAFEANVNEVYELLNRRQAELVRGLSRRAGKAQLEERWPRSSATQPTEIASQSTDERGEPG